MHAFVDDSYLVDKGLTQLLGLQLDRASSRRSRATSKTPDAQRVQGHGQPVPRAWHRGHPRRGLQPHRRRQRARSDAVVQGHRQCSYYRLLPDQKRYYINDTGTGNTVNLSHPRVLQMVADSLRYWATEMRVDGFRFDLATILGARALRLRRRRRLSGHLPAGPGAVERKADRGALGYRPGRLSGRAVPAGVGRMERQVSRHRPRVLEGRRRQSLPIWPTRISGSGDLFNKRGRRPWASVNFVTAHDGFNLNDLVSYNDKHNEANGEDNQRRPLPQPFLELRRRRADRRSR